MYRTFFRNLSVTSSIQIPPVLLVNQWKFFFIKLKKPTKKAMCNIFLYK